MESISCKLSHLQDDLYEKFYYYESSYLNKPWECCSDLKPSKKKQALAFGFFILDISIEAVKKPLDSIYFLALATIHLVGSIFSYRYSFSHSISYIRDGINCLTSVPAHFIMLAIKAPFQAYAFLYKQGYRSNPTYSVKDFYPFYLESDIAGTLLDGMQQRVYLYLENLRLSGYKKKVTFLKPLAFFTNASLELLKLPLIPIQKIAFSALSFLSFLNQSDSFYLKESLLHLEEALSYVSCIPTLLLIDIPLSLYQIGKELSTNLQPEFYY